MLHAHELVLRGAEGVRRHVEGVQHRDELNPGEHVLQPGSGALSGTAAVHATSGGNGGEAGRGSCAAGQCPHLQVLNTIEDRLPETRRRREISFKEMMNVPPGAQKTSRY